METRFSKLFLSRILSTYILRTNDTKIATLRVLRNLSSWTQCDRNKLQNPLLNVLLVPWCSRFEDLQSFSVFLFIFSFPILLALFTWSFSRDEIALLIFNRSGPILNASRIASEQENRNRPPSTHFPTDSSQKLTNHNPTVGQQKRSREIQW